MKCDEEMLDILFIICNSGLAFDGFVESLEGASLACLIVFRGQWTSPVLLLDRQIFEHYLACQCISTGGAGSHTEQLYSNFGSMTLEYSFDHTCGLDRWNFRYPGGVSHFCMYGQCVMTTLGLLKLLHRDTWSAVHM